MPPSLVREILFERDERTLSSSSIKLVVGLESKREEGLIDRNSRDGMATLSVEKLTPRIKFGMINIIFKYLAGQCWLNVVGKTLFLEEIVGRRRLS
jgi:hypothetical protein